MKRNKYFTWNDNNEISSYCDKYIDYIMAEEDAANIFIECEILDIIDTYIEENNISDEAINLILDIKECVMDKIETDVANFAIDELL